MPGLIICGAILSNQSIKSSPEYPFNIEYLVVAGGGGGGSNHAGGGGAGGFRTGTNFSVSAGTNYTIAVGAGGAGGPPGGPGQYGVIV